MQNGKKERITISIEKELLEWLDEKVQKRIFANRSHGFEFLIAREIEKKHKDKKGGDQ